MNPASSSTQQTTIRRRIASVFLAVFALLAAPHGAFAQNIWERLTPVTPANSPSASPQFVRLQAAPADSGIWARQPAIAQPTAIAAPPNSFSAPQFAAAPAPASISFPTPAPPAVEPRPTPAAARPADLPPGSIATARELLARCEALGRKPLVYKFGSSDSSTGGLDCSGTVVELLKSIGFTSVPRTAYDQYRWLEKNGNLHKTRKGTSASRILNNLRPGQLIFWKGTYKTSKPVTHVMVYMGKSSKGQHYMFGARGRSKNGLYGNGVDVFTFNLESNRTKHPIVGFGDIPGLAYLY